MVQGGNQQPVASPETAGLSDEQLLRRYQQEALERGVALSKVNAYLLRQVEVPAAVKELIEKEMEEGVETMETGVEVERPVQPSVPEETRRPEVTGEVKVLDTRTQIQKIREESGGAFERGEQEGAVEISSEAAAEKPQPQEAEGLATQTAEQKEVTTTAGKMDSSAGVSLRQSLGMSGYAPSQQVAQNTDELAEKGDVHDAKTWQAMLLKRFLELWGSFKALFSE